MAEYQPSKSAAEDLAVRQAAGHAGDFSFDEKEGKVHKLVSYENEVKFYERAQKDEFGILTENHLIPKYYGKITKEYVNLHDGKSASERVKETRDFFVLEDLTQGFREPNMFDIKMGTQTWDRETPAKKVPLRIKQDGECTTGTYGFRFCGLRFSGCLPENRFYGWDAMEDDKMLECLAFAFKNFPSVEKRNEALKGFCPRIALVKQFLEEGGWHIVCASFLIVYDSVAVEEGGHPPVIYLIDFAHALETSKEERDEGFIKGCSELMRFFETLSEIRE